MDKENVVYTCTSRSISISVSLYDIVQPLKGNEILILATTWMNLEDIMQSERSQTPKDKYCMTLLISGNQSGGIHRDRKQMRGCQRLEGGGLGMDKLMGRELLWLLKDSETRQR